MNKSSLAKGIFVLSLDTELCWGVIDKPDQLKKNKKYYEQARECIDKILVLLEKYDISATWAVVGHLFLQQCKSCGRQKPSNISRNVYPCYRKDRFEQCPCTNEKEAPLWYGRDIINKIMNCKVHQEVGCHSFAHIPYGDVNTKRDAAKNDLSNCVCEAEKYGLKLRSFVFPRNDEGYIDELQRFGFEAYRGVEPTWYRRFPRKLKKICHIIDQFLVTRPPVSLPEYRQGIYNIPGSMFYLPMNGFRRLIPLRFRIYKARKGIESAIKHKKVFHLWFHPFNIATSQEKLLHGLEEIFKYVKEKRQSCELKTKSMCEIVDMLSLS